MQEAWDPRKHPIACKYQVTMDLVTGHRIIDLNELSLQPTPQNRPSPPIVNPPPPPANREEYVHVHSPTISLDSYYLPEYGPMVPYYPDIPLSIQPSRSITPV